MKRIGLLGCGKIGGKILEDLLEKNEHGVSFVQDPYYQNEKEASFPVITKQDQSILQCTDLVIESATADVLRKNIDGILKFCDIMIFSVTAFSDEVFYQHVQDLIKKYNRKIFIPHGAILGLDGIADANKLISSVTIETTKNPKSLGRTDKERTILYEGSTRDACKIYPRNVNVHASVALAGIGFDKTRSKIISDPSVSQNTHTIIVEGEGIHFELLISSYSFGSVTGKYTPYSAVASLHRILDDKPGIRFV